MADQTQLIPAVRPHPDREAIPRVLIRAMMALALATLAIAGFAVLTDRTPTGLPDHSAPVVREVTVHLNATRAGHLTVTDASGVVLADLTADRAGFSAVAAQMLARKRAVAGVDPDGPVRIVEYDGGRTALVDDTTGWSLQLRAFGSDSAATLTRYLED